MKPFEAPQKSVKKIKLVFVLIQLPEMHRAEGIRDAARGL